MSTTGLVAQAYGQNDLTQLAALLKRSLVLSCFVAVLLIALSPLIKHAIAFLSAANSYVLTQAYQYFSICIFSAPAALCNFSTIRLDARYALSPNRAVFIYY